MGNIQHSEHTHTGNIRQELCPEDAGHSHVILRGSQKERKTASNFCSVHGDMTPPGPEGGEAGCLRVAGAAGERPAQALSAGRSQEEAPACGVLLPYVNGGHELEQSQKSRVLNAGQPSEHLTLCPPLTPQTGS